MRYIFRQKLIDRDEVVDFPKGTVFLGAEVDPHKLGSWLSCLEPVGKGTKRKC